MEMVSRLIMQLGSINGSLRQPSVFCTDQSKMLWISLDEVVFNSASALYYDVSSECYVELLNYEKKKDYEVALVGAFKREREQEATLQALTAETQAAMQLKECLPDLKILNVTL
ncbi:hypothetical protein V6N13_061756 [Hibiscus sabdariffa]